MRYTNYKLIILVALISLAAVNTANAGLISLITKAGNAAKKADFDAPILKIELPENLGDASPARIRPNSTGQWDIKLDNDTTLSFDDLVKRNAGNKDKSVLILDAADIPDNFAMFENIPTSLPIYISGKGGKLFEFKRGKVSGLQYKDVHLKVASIKQLKDGIWHLQRPVLSGPVRFFQLDSGISKEVPAKVYGSKKTVEKVSGNALLDSIASLRRQTMVISAPIKNSKLQGVSIKKLQKAAAENDINLIIIDSDTPAKLLKRFAKEANEGNRSINDLYNTTGDFFNKFRDPKNPTPFELNLSDTGGSQSVIQLKPAKKTEVNKISSVVNDEMINASHVTLHVLAKAVTVYRPDIERSKELDQRIVPWLHSDIQYYLIISTVLGLIVFSTSWGLWKKIWLLRGRKQYSNVLLFLVLWVLHRLLFITVFITIFGFLCFLYAVVMVVVRTINFLFVRPMRWIIGKVVS